MKENHNRLVVSRHKNFHKWLCANNIVPKDTPYKDYVTIEDIKGRHVIGTLPLHLAAYTFRYTEVPLRIPLEKRGQLLTVEEIAYYAQEPCTYEIKQISRGL